MKTALYVLLAIAALVVVPWAIRFVKTITRARGLGLRYGIPTGMIIRMYNEWHAVCVAGGHAPTLRAFEGVLRLRLADIQPDVKHIKPLYCEGLDPLNPYIPDKK